MNKELLELSHLYTDKPRSTMVVPPEGKAHEYISIEKAVEHNKPFMVMPKWNMFVIDCDSTVEIFSYYQYKNYLKKNNISFYEWNSGRIGHRHLVASFKSAQDQQDTWDFAKNLRTLKPALRHNRPCRPTLAPHRSSLSVSMVPHYNLEDVRRVLNIRSKDRWIRPTDYPSEIDVSEQNRYLVRNKAIKQRFAQIIINGPGPNCQDRSAAINQCSMSMVNSNYSDDEGAMLLCNPKHKISAHILESRKGRPDRQFEYAKHFMRQARKFVEKNPSNHVNNTLEARIVRSQIKRIFKHISNLPWSGQQGNSEFACLRAHLHIASKAGSFSYGLSVREQELLTGLSIMTLRKANARLIEKGWLRKIKAPFSDKAASQVWEFIIPESLFSSHTSPVTPLNAGDCANLETDLTSKIFQVNLAGKQRGLGQSAGRIYAQMKLGKSQINDLVKATGLSRVTVWRALKRLEDAGMTTPDQKITGYVPEYMVESAIRKENTMRIRHEREREGWQEVIFAYEMSLLKAA